MQIKIGLGAIFVLGLCLTVTGQTMANVAGTQNPTAAQSKVMDAKGIGPRSPYPFTTAQKSAQRRDAKCDSNCATKLSQCAGNAEKARRRKDPPDPAADQKYMKRFQKCVRTCRR